MALTISLLSGDLPPVRIVIPGADVPASDPWTLTASGAGLSWQVRGGSGTGAGAQVVLVDTLAPVNVTITYSLTVAGTVTQSGTITRTWSGTGGDGLARDAVADLLGSTVSGVRRLPSDRRSGERRYHASRVPGSRYLPLRLDAVAGAGGGSMSVASVGSATTALQTLLDGNGLLAYYHDTSRCDLPGCPIPAVEILYVAGESSDIGPRRDVGEREWSLEWLAQADPEPDTSVAVSDLDDLDAAGLDLDALDALTVTWDEWDALDLSTIGA